MMPTCTRYMNIQSRLVYTFSDADMLSHGITAVVLSDECRHSMSQSPSSKIWLTASNPGNTYGVHG